jgi:hypothetical protein
MVILAEMLACGKQKGGDTLGLSPSDHLAVLLAEMLALRC